MALAPPYTPTASQPDPEAFTKSGTQTVQVGPYNALIYTGSLIENGPVTVLFVEIPLGNGQRQDLVVGAHGLSDPELITLVANGLSVPWSATPISGPSGVPTPAGDSGASRELTPTWGSDTRPVFAGSGGLFAKGVRPRRSGLQHHGAGTALRRGLRDRRSGSSRAGRTGGGADHVPARFLLEAQLDLLGQC